jgi:hypothetical protein
MTLKPDVEAGLSAGVKCWLFFMISLFLLRYDPMLSITLGALGGLAGGFVEACLKAKPDDGPAKEDKPVEAPEPVTDSSALRKSHSRYGFGQMRTRRQQGAKRQFDLPFFRRRS